MKLLIDATSVLVTTSVIDLVMDADDANSIDRGSEGILIDEHALARLHELHAAHEVTLHAPQTWEQLEAVRWLRAQGFTVTWSIWRELLRDADAAVTVRAERAKYAARIPALSLHTWEGPTA